VAIALVIALSVDALAISSANDSTAGGLLSDGEAFKSPPVLPLEEFPELE